MARIKIDYGIDLGTTNSAIARMENGESVIKQTKNLMDTLPSCVYFSKNKKGERALRIGMKAKDSVYSDAITALSKNEPPKECGYLEFKREMGSDKKYSNENMPKDSYSPEELSAEVLKELKSLINDETVNSVVITVPAMFTAIQKDATMKAARIAGFKQCELLQEPIAACMAYGLSSEKKDGKWLVFDFGGGTFDAALVKVEDGILTVFDTEGDNYLGGKNLDEAVVNKILMPSLKEDYALSSYETTEWKKKALIDALKGPAEEMRIALSFADSADYSTYDRNLNLGQDDNGEEIDLEITITKDQLIDAVGEQYKKAVGIVPDRKTTQALRPGVSTDVLSIPVYQVSGLEAEGKTAALNTQISNVVVTGDDVEQLIPENSNVEITLHVDSSEMMTMEVYFPSVDFTVKKELDLSKRESSEDAISWVNKELGSAQRSIEALLSSGISVEELTKELDSVKELASSRNDPMRTMSNLKELLRKIEELDDSTEWQRVERELREEFDRLENAQNELGNDKSALLVNQIRGQVDNVIRVKDAKLGREILDQISSLFVHLTLVYQCMGLIRDCHNRFGTICWKDSTRARQLVNRGLEEINNQPSVDKLHPIVCGLIDLMPNEEAANAGGLLK